MTDPCLPPVVEEDTEVDREVAYSGPAEVEVAGGGDFEECSNAIDAFFDTAVRTHAACSISLYLCV